MTFTIASDKAVVGTGQYAYAILRHQASGGEYWGKIHFTATGGIYLNASAYSGTAEVVLGPEVTSGLTRVPGTAVNVRFQVIGTSPATIRGRAWAVGATEPTTWTFTDTDSTVALQDAGTVGVRATTSSTSTNIPITFRFDNLTVLDLGAGATASISQVRTDPFGPRVPSVIAPVTAAPRLRSHREDAGDGPHRNRRFGPIPALCPVGWADHNVALGALARGAAVPIEPDFTGSPTRWKSRSSGPAMSAS